MSSELELPKFMFFRKLICAVLGHKYKLKRTITPTIRELTCTCCTSEFGMSDEQKCVLVLDEELRECHEELLECYNNHQKDKLND